MLYFLLMVVGVGMLVVGGIGVIIATGLWIPILLFVVFFAILGAFDKPSKPVKPVKPAKKKEWWE